MIHLGGRRINRPCTFIAVLLAILSTAAWSQGQNGALQADALRTKSPDELTRQIIALAENDHIALLEMVVDRYDRTIRDYSGTFIKQERIKGKLGPVQVIDFKFRQEPFSLFMEWKENPLGADRMLYVEGQNDDKMLIHPTGLMKWLKCLKLGPNSKQAKKSTLRPCEKFGFRRNILEALKVYRLAKQNGELTTRSSGPKTIDGREYLILERILPKKKGYPSGRLVVRLDMEYLLPVQIECYNRKGKLLGRYAFDDLKFNTNLTDRDFQPKANNL